MDLEGVLINRKITKEHLHSIKSSRLDWEMLNKVVDISLEKLLEISRVGVVYDVDVDGLISGKIIEEYIKKKGVMVFRFMNNRKKHGITNDVVNWVSKEGIELLYVVDAGTNDIENHKKLSDMGITVIVLDHHEQSEKYDVENVYIANCSIESHLPKLSGAGVCYRYIESLDREMCGTGVSVYEPWVGLTVLSDHCSMIDPENRYYVEKLYENYDKIDLFQAFTFWGSKRNLFLFGVIPFLNACIRTNHGDWAMNVVLMGGVSKIKSYIKEKKELVLEEQKRVIKIMRDHCMKREGSEFIVIRLNNEHIEYSGLTGLLANQLLGELKKSIIVMYEEDGYFKGSFRGTGAINNKILEECGWKVLGHPQAAGIELEKSKAKEVINQTLDIKQGEQKSEFDFELEDRDIVRNFNDLVIMARFNEMTGADLETIKFRLKKTREPFIEEWDKKVEYDFQSFRVRDFNKSRKAKEDWIIEPLLDKEGIVLLRQ